MLSSSGAAAPTPRPHAHSTRLTCAGATDPGLVREYNEDHFGLFPELGLFMVADGMGGAAAGEVAAKMAVNLVHDAFADPDVTWPTGDEVPRTTGPELLATVLRRANHCIHQAAAQTPATRGMGTTIAALLAGEARVAVAHVGDSRVYRFREGRLEALTEDHSLLNDLVRAGLADPDHPEDFEHHNIITRALGVNPFVEADARWVDVAIGDTFLLCSDGLTGPVKPSELTEILRVHPDLEDAVGRLIARANDLGGPDNVTAVLVRVG